MGFRHIDEARERAVAFLIEGFHSAPAGAKAVLIEDLYGKLRLVLWPGKKPDDSFVSSLRQGLASEAGQAWAEDIWLVTKDVLKPDLLVYEGTWDEAIPHPDEARLRLMDRHRTRGAWMAPFTEPPWAVGGRGKQRGPPILVFYSFKGGVGRTTALASFAIQRARRGERVAVIDTDFDAPGVGTLLAADRQGTTARWGAVDYLLERPQGPVEFRDYYHACRREPVTGNGEILVIPAGRIDAGYVGKLSRLDLEPRPVEGEGAHPLLMLLDETRDALQPQWILIDSRAGLADSAGLLLQGLGHLYVLFGTSSEQSWRGLRLVIDRLGADRVQRKRAQAECLLVHAMVPRSPEVFAEAAAEFSERARDEFSEHFYAASEDEGFWSVDDAEGSDSPHVPIPIAYDEKMARFRTLDDVADLLADSPELRILHDRIAARFEES